MAQLLEGIPNLSHSLYADDITLWVTKGNDGEIEHLLQTGADIVSEHARKIGLSCSPQKSELLVMRYNPRGHTKTSVPIEIYVDDTLVPEVQTIRILGMHVYKATAKTQ